MPSLYLWIAALVIAASAFGGTYIKGRTDGKEVVQEQWDSEKAARIVAENKAVAARIAENAAIAAKNHADKLKLKEKYANEIAKLRADRDKPVRLYVPAGGCGPAGTETNPGTSGSRPDVAGTGVLSDALTANILSLMDQADEVVAGCRVAQDFIKQNGMAP